MKVNVKGAFGSPHWIRTRDLELVQFNLQCSPVEIVD